MVDIAKYLRNRANPYVRGERTVDQYTVSSRKEASFILQEGGEFSEALPIVIGSTLSQKADQRLGNVMPFGRAFSSDVTQMVISKVARARVYVSIYFWAALDGLILST